MMDECPLVMIEWEDSRQPEPNWSLLSSFAPGDAVRCISAGWMIHDGKDVKVLAPNMGDIGDEDVQVSGVIRIPARCILKITKIKTKQKRLAVDGRKFGRLVVRHQPLASVELGGRR